MGRQRWVWSLLVVCLLVCVPVATQAQCLGVAVPLVALDHESITVAGTAIGFTAAKIVQTAGTAAMAVLTTEDAPIRFTVNGTTPTSTVGHLIQPSATVIICGSLDINKFRSIRTTGTSGTAVVTYFKSAR